MNSSVDGKVRRYDIRFGKLFTDTIDRKHMQIGFPSILVLVHVFFIEWYIHYGTYCNFRANHVSKVNSRRSLHTSLFT